jgi:hypothetical protein
METAVKINMMPEKSNTGVKRIKGKKKGDKGNDIRKEEENYFSARKGPSKVKYDDSKRSQRHLLLGNTS